MLVLLLSLNLGNPSSPWVPTALNLVVAIYFRGYTTLYRFLHKSKKKIDRCESDNELLHSFIAFVVYDQKNLLIANLQQIWQGLAISGAAR